MNGSLKPSFIKSLEDRYVHRESGDPQGVWYAIKYFANEKDPLPEWVAIYLNKVATELLNLDATGKYFPGEVARIIGLKQGSLSKQKKADRDYIIYLVIKDYNDRGEALPKCFEKAASLYSLAEATVEKIYKQQRSQFNKFVQRREDGKGKRGKMS